jgi:hypothetical protein
MKLNKLMYREIQVPVILSGIISRIEGPDIYMDGASHVIITVAGNSRLVARNPEALEFLNKVSGTRLRVTVIGYPVNGPECTYISVFYASPTDNVVHALGIEK